MAKAGGNSGSRVMGKLTAAGVRTIRTEGKHLDGDGLALVVRGTGRSWHYRYQRGGRERVMSLGDADVITLAEARKLHSAARAQLLAGQDPLEARTRAKVDLAHTFADTAAVYIAAHEAKWRSPKSAPQWRASLAAYALPTIGKLPVAEIDTHHVLRVLRPIWQRIPETASRVRSRIELVLDYATAMRWRAGPNPAVWRGGLRPLLPATSQLKEVRHHVALPWEDCPALIRELGQRTNIASMALSFLILTATRSGEARGARWEEFDLSAAVWTIPANRMKARKEHRVPLSKPALAIVQRMAELRSGELIFPGQNRHRPLNDPTLTDQLRRLGHANATVHGFRSAFRDWCADTGKPADLAEAALAHAPVSRVVAAYQRSDLLEARRQLMQAWADHLTGAVVVPLRAVTG
jgi:integrase